jgi:hypothetical protein
MQNNINRPITTSNKAPQNPKIASTITIHLPTKSLVPQDKNPIQLKYQSTHIKKPNIFHQNSEHEC